MKWLFAIWRMRQVPTVRELPGLYLRAVVFGVLTGPLFSLLAAGSGAFSLPGMLVATFVGAVFSVSFFTACGIGNSLVRRATEGQPSAIRGTASIGFNAVAAPLAFTAAAGTVSSVLQVEFPWFWRTIVIEAIAGIVLSVVIGSFLKLKEQVERAQAEVREKEISTARAQAMALQAQINPHFFFNTLNTISALIDSDPGTAQKMIGLMAGMFRYTFGASTSTSVTLEEEVGFVRDYLAIEQARFCSRLRVDFPGELPPGVMIPGLVLQPLVENAVQHGIAELIDGGTVRLAIAKEELSWRITVHNSADPGSIPDPAMLFKPGHALDNVRKRLRLYTGEAEPLRFAAGSDWVELSFTANSAAKVTN